MVIEQHLNLARKWRSKNFDQIIGQDLTVKMLKNSLYLNQFFPVYLFAGQRGCGKTSTARVFAAAINCEKLAEFQANPRSCSLPCLACDSCIAMMTGKHPDFIEIDAASHTGVDNVRMIIDASSLLPQMGRKKIYLIDEAHMLSKAAFNAFLKLLEEPPMSVLFILATTDTQKIIETVRSRCFALYFKSIEMGALSAHLETICTAESIAYEKEALSVIIKESEGSARDALNLLEQVRFSSSSVSYQAVQRVLGHIDESCLLQVFETVLHKSPADFLSITQRVQLDSFSTEFVWTKMIELIRASLWIKCGVSPLHFGAYTEQLSFLIRGVSAVRLTAMLETFYAHEQAFKKTTAQYPLLELLLLRMCQKNESNSSSGTPSLAAASAPDDTILDDDEDCDEEESDDAENIPADDADCASPWRAFVLAVEVLDDQLLRSIFKQGIFLSLQNNVVTVEFAKDFSFFQDWLENAKAVWQPLLHKAFATQVTLQAQFTGEKIRPDAPASASSASRPTFVPPVRKKEVASNYSGSGQQQRYQTRRPAAPMTMHKESKLDISDAAHWATTHMICSYFPGVVTQVRETA